MIGVTGATGKLGQLVMQELLKRVEAKELVAIVRSPEKAQSFEAKGVHIRQADYDDPAGLEKALHGIERLLLISANEVGKRYPQHQNVIRSAQKTGVQWIVYTSLLHADTSLINLAEEHRQTESFLKNAGVPYTFLRNGWYTENYEGTVRSAVEHGALLGSAGSGRIASAARKDYAEAAAHVLTTDGHVGKTYELAGDQAWTMDDLARAISHLTGKNIVYRNLPVEEYADILTNSGIPEDYAKMIADWDRATAEGSLYDDSQTLKQLIGRPTTPLTETIQSWI